ncbi:glycosyltransferase family 2 protein [Oceanimonas pelagia]|uniref:Glycosyltransferase family 2 protein n=1 Tax=Oceanimonas pelagia TaxID=3028314 RepID=A0AA50QCR6_9GAMM|nr:glycosyltransferase family 2 protein [Oceanimonas pelagia]WMC11512.1 glycosyltransferase family 2 protein [Oceanimonas pelagia]
MSDLSIVITSFNRPLLLTRAVQSVLDNAGQIEIEVIVVDDASSEPLPSFRDEKVKVLRMEKNGGPGPARMRGIRAAKAPWVMILDDDDVVKPGAFSILSRALRGQDYSSCSVIQFARSNGSLEGCFRVVKLSDYLNGKIKGDFTPVFNRSNFLGTGLSYPDNRAGGEHILWWELAKEYNGIPSFSDVLVLTLEDAESRLTNVSSQIRKAEDHYQLAQATLNRFGEILKKDFPQEYRRVCLGRITYGLLSGRRKEAREHLSEMPNCGAIRAVLWVITWAPLFLVKALFRLYRQR